MNILTTGQKFLVATVMVTGAMAWYALSTYERATSADCLARQVSSSGDRTEARAASQHNFPSVDEVLGSGNTVADEDMRAKQAYEENHKLYVKQSLDKVAAEIDGLEKLLLDADSTPEMAAFIRTSGALISIEESAIKEWHSTDQMSDQTFKLRAVIEQYVALLDPLRKQKLALDEALRARTAPGDSGNMLDAINELEWRQNVDKLQIPYDLRPALMQPIARWQTPLDNYVRVEFDILKGFDELVSKDSLTSGNLYKTDAQKKQLLVKLAAQYLRSQAALSNLYR